MKKLMCTVLAVLMSVSVAFAGEVKKAEAVKPVQAPVTSAKKAPAKKVKKAKKVAKKAAAPVAAPVTAPAAPVAPVKK